jgi:hypothetical protein
MFTHASTSALIDAFQSIGSHVVDKLIPLSLAFAD